MYTCAWVSSLCHFCVQRLLTVRAGPCRYSCLHVFKTDIDPVGRGVLCWGHILISTTVSFPNLEGLRGTLLPRWRGIALLSGCPGWKGSWLSSYFRGETEAQTWKGTCCGTAVSFLSFSGLMVHLQERLVFCLLGPSRNLPRGWACPPPWGY